MRALYAQIEMSVCVQLSEAEQGRRSRAHVELQLDDIRSLASKMAGMVTRGMKKCVDELPHYLEAAEQVNSGPHQIPAANAANPHHHAQEITASMAKTGSIEQTVLHLKDHFLQWLNKRLPVSVGEIDLPFRALCARMQALEQSFAISYRSTQATAFLPPVDSLSPSQAGHVFGQEELDELTRDYHAVLHESTHQLQNSASYSHEFLKDVKAGLMSIGAVFSLAARSPKQIAQKVREQCLSPPRLGAALMPPRRPPSRYATRPTKLRGSSERTP
jgi:hypothetical protein